jgi:hypothetical protein
MPFDADVKTRMFIRCARLCCLCYKQCGTNIEAAHIIAEKDGGPSEEENGIPLCFDCHTEVGHYNDKHPKGNKFRPDELKGRRNHVYKLVESGVIHAQIVASQARAKAKGAEPALPADVSRPEPSSEAKRLLKTMIAGGASTMAPGGKMKLLSADDRAYVLDQLVEEAPGMPDAVEVLLRTATSKLVSEAESKVIIELTTRQVTIAGTPYTKAALLRGIPKEVLAASAADVRQALFEEIIEIIDQDQFGEVNELVPALVEHCAAVPPELHREFVLALLRHSRSSARRGAPAAIEALKTLPDDMARVGVNAIEAKYLVQHGPNDVLKRFATQYQHLATGAQKGLLADFVSLPRRQFAEKHLPDDDN